MSALKLIFNLSNKKTATWSLTDPKADLTAADIQDVADDIIHERAITVNDGFPETLKASYIQNSTKQQLV